MSLAPNSTHAQSQKILNILKLSFLSLNLCKFLIRKLFQYSSISRYASIDPTRHASIDLPRHASMSLPPATQRENLSSNHQSELKRLPPPRCLSGLQLNSHYHSTVRTFIFVDLSKISKNFSKSRRLRKGI